MKNVEKKGRNNRSMNSKHDYESLVPYEVLEAAIEGNASAIYEIVKHYGRYIMKFMREEKYTGKRNSELDEDGVEVIKIALIKSFPGFKKKYRT